MLPRAIASDLDSPRTFTDRLFPAATNPIFAARNGLAEKGTGCKADVASVMDWIGMTALV